MPLSLTTAVAPASTDEPDLAHTAIALHPARDDMHRDTVRRTPNLYYEQQVVCSDKCKYH